MVLLLPSEYLKQNCNDRTSHGQSNTNVRNLLQGFCIFMFDLKGLENKLFQLQEEINLFLKYVFLVARWEKKNSKVMTIASQ